MGLSLSRLISTWNEILMRKFFMLSDEIEASIARSISFGSRDGGEVIVRALSFKNREQLDDKLQKCERQMINRLVPLQALVVSHNANDRISKLSPPVTEPVLFSSPRPIEELDSAATKVQKVYKSYRTRRNLADCAVVIRELWWKTLDSAALNQSSISFFNNNGQETAASRWTRARIKAAKVGKGLSKDEKAQMLALHHWLEAIDPRHRYGRNLHFYYDVWSDKKSYQPFFYWLDIGDGKEVNLSSCPRVELQQQCIQYLGPKERDIYEVIVDEGKLMYKQSGMFLDTDEKSKWIFVLSASRSLYVGRKIKGVFQHSSFLSGGVTSSAGRLTATTGVLEAIWPYSGHYLPTDDNFKAFISFLEEHHVDMTNIKRCSIDDDSPPLKAKNKGSFKASTNIDPSMITSDLAAFKELVADRIPQDVGGAINTVNINAPKLVLPKSTSFKWTSGVGPRIGCVRDYPIELQSQALEKVNLSPTLNPSPRYSKSDDPIPSPRPSSKLRFSPRVANMGLLSPRASQSIAN